jgi:hypothetical protein
VDWSPEKAHAALLAANRFGRVGQDDAAALKDLLQALDTGGADMDLTGYSADELERLMTQVHQDGADVDGGGLDAGSQYGVIVMCAGEAEQREVYEKLLAEGYSVKVVCV